ncbi:hypothetical protein QR680_018296 [Steinernema hermaphroditum]|uniref:Oxysterol-binding protein n=1 Tax=Steinernema hermaphroditum TaxID=289476 RepID=A0AA39HHI3_9BILA|nr:hypothetical protein QR680_018296 [Steinernema hermaphroditum]
MASIDACSAEQRRKGKTNEAKRKSESAFSKFSKRLKKRTEFVPFPELSDKELSILEAPPKLEGTIFLKGCKKRRLNRTKRFHAKLSLGVLKLYKGRNTKSADALNHEFKIDLSQISVSHCDAESRFLLMFKQESHQLFPVEKDKYSLWKDAVQKHRLYRQKQLKQGTVNSEASVRLKAPLEKTEDKAAPEAKANEPIAKTLEEIRATRASVNDALEKNILCEIKTRSKELQNQPPVTNAAAVEHHVAVAPVVSSYAINDTASAVPSDVTSIADNAVSSCVQSNTGISTTNASATAVCEGSDGMSESGSSSESDEEEDDEDVQTVGDPSISTRSLEATRNRKNGKSSKRKRTQNAEAAPSQPQQQIEPPKYNLIRSANVGTETSAAPVPQQIPKPSPAPTPEPIKTQPLPAPVVPQKPVPEPTKAVPEAVVPPPPPKTSVPPTVSACTVPKAKPSPYQPRSRVHRMTLPSEQLPGEGISLGMLTSLAFGGGLPISTYEPLGMLQLLCESNRFASTFLSKAAVTTDSMERMCLVVAFAISGYSNTIGRNRKPFNPLLGETFEYIADEGWRFHAEQVSHHPPISACYADGPGWEVWENFAGQPKKRWKNVDVIPEVPLRLRLNGKEDYTWKKVKTTVVNAIAKPEERILQHEGIMNVRCSNGVNARIEFKGEKNSVSGTVSGPNGEVRISGTWDRAIYKHGEDGRERIFEAAPPLPNTSRYYGFNRFSMTLNETIPEDMSTLPPTDTRLRPDQRFLENGEAQRALSAKQVLEQNQRNRANRSHRRLWFVRRTDSFTDVDMWVSQKNYWEAKEEGFRDVTGSIARIFSLKEK